MRGLKCRLTPTVAGGLLFVIYLASLAPGVTLWDAGEFIAAVRTLGIPHPPGTPLFILLGRTWTLLLGFLPTAFALNLFSAACTAVAGAVTATLVLRSTGLRSVAIAAALIAGTMSTAWLNATETEVYAASLLLSMTMLIVADQAGRTGEERWVILLAYLMTLSVPLHLSALVAAPAAIVLAADRVLLDDFVPSARSMRAGVWQMMTTWSWAWVLLLAGVMVLAVAASAASRTLLVIGAALLALASQNLPRGSRSRVAIAIPVIVLALSALVFMLVRARFDPGINQGDPATIERWMAVITREQYAVAPLWPRQAPLWIQLGNMLQYFDWQLALSLEPEPPLSAARGAVTIIGLLLGVAGSADHHRMDPRRWRAVLILFLSGSIGVLVHLNLKAGPSIGWDILADSAPHEPRERDYFFVLAFWAWGIWIAIGAAAAVRRFLRAAGYVLREWQAPFARRFNLVDVGVLLVSLLPLLLNWKAVERRSEPGGSLARTSGLALLSSVPPRGVLFVAGDNDSYPLWYLQHVERFRTDVTVITIPIIPADWYRDELARRHGLHTPEKWVGLSGEMSALAKDAQSQGRPVVAAVSVDPSERDALGGISSMRGWVWTIDSIADGLSPNVLPPDRILDSVPNLTGAERAALIASPSPVPPGQLRYLSPAERYMLRLLACPRHARALAYHKTAADSLDSTCNFR